MLPSGLQRSASTNCATCVQEPFSKAVHGQPRAHVKYLNITYHSQIARAAKLTLASRVVATPHLYDYKASHSRRAKC